MHRRPALFLREGRGSGLGVDWVEGMGEEDGWRRSCWAGKKLTKLLIN